MNRSRPIVWYVAAGYKLPAGIEAYLCHYATEMRNHGFDTRIIVFYPLPREKHRFLKLLEKRSIPIMSLYDETAILPVVLSVLFSIPWFLYMLAVKRQCPGFGAFHSWMQNRCAVNNLAAMIREESPDIIHVKGRLPTNAWAVFPSERTIYHHALMGTVDPSWTENEVQDFRVFANRIARVFTPGKAVAETLAREYRIERQINPLFTMVPEEGEEKAETGNLRPEVGRGEEEKAEGGLPEPISSRVGQGNLPALHSSLSDGGKPEGRLRFGILCRFTEQKGIKYILEALRGFKAKYGDVDFTFAGQGELAPVIQRFIDTEGLKNVRVLPLLAPVQVSGLRFQPSLPVVDPVAVLRKMDVFVHPGLDDAMPVSIVEALMCGLPCISTKVGGTPDLLRDGVEGFLVEPGNAGQILECMERFAKMPADELDGFRRRARTRYEEVCLPEMVGKQVAEHYRSILAGMKQ